MISWDSKDGFHGMLVEGDDWDGDLLGCINTTGIFHDGWSDDGDL